MLILNSLSRSRSRSRLFAICCALMSLAFSQPSFAEKAETGGPRAVATIQPLHSLLSSVMSGVVEPALLIKPTQSPHKVYLRPSQVKSLSEADLVVWIGTDLESGLSKSVEGLGDSIQVLTLGALPSLASLPMREGGRWQAHNHGAGHKHKHSADPHFWLSPLQAARVARVLMEQLMQIDPKNADRYEANTQSLLVRLKALDSELDQRLEGVRDVPFLVFHDAYQYFQQRYHLNAVGSVTIDPQKTPGARRVAELRSRIKETGARCVFIEPQFEPRMVQTLIEGSEARVGEMDPIGVGIAPGPDAYFQLMNALADGLLDCLPR